MMLEHLGFPESGDLVMEAMKSVLAEGICTADIGGKAKTAEVTDAICAKIRKTGAGAR
jgi:tartrate dehydrogenase/decarboxylase/D-malate dehydrogenase